MTSISKRGGFTLVELLVVIGMIAIIMGALTTSVAGAQRRAMIQKAEAEVKSVTQAVLAFENYNKNYELPTYDQPTELNGNTLKFLIGKGGKSEHNTDIPVLLMASLSSGQVMKDPWGTPYQLTIRKGNIPASGISNIRTGFALPNFHRLSSEERK